MNKNDSGRAGLPERDQARYVEVQKDVGKDLHWQLTQLAEPCSCLRESLVFARGVEVDGTEIPKIDIVQSVVSEG